MLTVAKLVKKFSGFTESVELSWSSKQPQSGPGGASTHPNAQFVWGTDNFVSSDVRAAPTPDSWLRCMIICQVIHVCYAPLLTLSASCSSQPPRSTQICWKHLKMQCAELGRRVVRRETDIQGDHVACLFCFAYISALKMEAMCFSETSCCLHITRLL
jgi:hypothetical protein